MAPKRKSPAVAAAAVSPSPAAKKTKAVKPKRRRKIRYTIKKRSRKTTASPAVKKVNKEQQQQPPQEEENGEDEDADKEKSESVVADVTVVEASDKAGSTRFIIEHCKQCTSFKNQAAKFEKTLKDKIKGLEVSINPAKPRRGCFEVRDEEGNLFISLLDLKRPFPELKALNVEEHVEKIVSTFKK